MDIITADSRLTKTALVDMDSMIADFYWGCLDAYEKETGDKPRPNVLDTWDAKFPNGKDCFAYFSQPGFFRTLKPVGRAQQVLKDWHDRGAEIIILTAATLTNAPGEKFEWLTEHYPWIHRDNVMMAKRKEKVRGDLFLDDHGANAKKYRAERANDNTPIIGITYPYNIDDYQHFDWLVNDYMNLDRAWSTIADIVEGNSLLK
jgi:5'-nucleotidase